MSTEQTDDQVQTSSGWTRRKFVMSGIVGISALAVGGATRAMVNRQALDITHRTFAIPNLPRVFHGKTITLVSDIHSSPFMSLEDMRALVARVNALQSDMILIPGDFVTSEPSEIGPAAEALSELRAPLGVFGSTGNHDYYVGVDAVTKAMCDAGITMLRNENRAVTIGGESLYLLGVDDDDSRQIEHYVEGKSATHIEAAYRGIPEQSATILMVHKPYSFEAYARTNVGLMLSGHTHGGQIVLARIGRTVLSLSSLASSFVAGRYLAQESDSKTELYVSRGIGVVGLPIRVNCPSEITQITLVPKTA